MTFPLGSLRSDAAASSASPSSSGQGRHTRQRKQRSSEAPAPVHAGWKSQSLLMAGGVVWLLALIALITHDPADEACIGGGHAVVAIQVELGQSRDVDPKSLTAKTLGDQAWVHPVNSLQDDRLSIPQADQFTVFTQAGLEVISR